MNSAYIGKLMELAEKDHDILYLLADSGTGYDKMFRNNFPDQIYNFGIAEENMISAAAGMATVGKIPFVFAQGPFLVYRSLEFIRDDICFQNLNVKMIGTGSGVSSSSLGPTHHTTEDISVLRAMPNLMILSVATPIQVQACVEKAYEYRGPVYLKIEMNHEKEFFEEGYQFPDSGADVLADGEDIALFVTGSILEEAERTAEMLRADGLRVCLINLVSLKPVSEELILRIAQKVKLIVAIEEHNIHGGIGSILAEITAYNGVGCRILPVGIVDCFALGYGTRAAVRRKNGLDADSIYRRIREVL